jgi:hypothetical protein
MTTEIPNILYKYRDWDNTYHKRSLTETEIYFAAPTDFNDPFDCSIPFRYNEKDLTPENIFNKLVVMGRKLHPDWSEEQIHALAFDAQSKNLIQDEYHFERHDEATKERFNKTFGIISLTTEKNNFLMWSHYSNSHRGFSIGYDTKKLFTQTPGELGPVQYRSEFPKYGLFDDHVKYFLNYAYVKSDIWTYENEYRLLREGARKTENLKEDTIAEIIFGNKMVQSTKFEILKLIETKYPDAIVFDSKLHKSKFELTLERVR